MVSTSEKILEKSTKGATFLMLGQLFTKVVTFILNTLLVRFLSPRIFGITSFLEFLSSTVLFFSREAIRIATLRINGSNEGGHDGEDKDYVDDPNVLQAAVNLGYIPICIGFPLALVLMAWQYSNINEYFIELPFFSWSIFFIFVGILAELFSEPLYIVNQFMLNYKTRSEIEGLSVAASCIVNFCIIYWYENWINGTGETIHDNYKQEGIAILAFSLGKVTRAITVLCLYYVDYLRHHALKKQFSISLTKIKVSEGTGSYLFQSEIVQHFKKVYFQLCFKHLLTEGDKLIINSLCTIEEQGIYSLLSNYGSIITRLLFAPIEESLRLFLTRLLSNKSTSNLLLSMDVLINLVKFYVYLTIIIVIFGPTSSSFLLQFLIGSKWSSTSVLETISVYCFYLPFLSMNGILEAFFSSVASGDQILRHSYLMMLLSGVFLLNCWMFIDYFNLSLDGLILSNMINMALRIVYCAIFINGFYNKLFSGSKSRGSLALNFGNLKAIGFISLVVGLFAWCKVGYVQNFEQLFINILLAVLLVAAMIYKERALLMSFINKNRDISLKEN
ncbi:glycolipid translocation protein Ecym_6192 [Eremothecium cymbalariae DBVPG|uniref:Man(5)GlcNAc(2)-PP-dolichol translocation protein RFT1 n=1 Tax=Eremothecium cymbalariae (strain CBS 270.75 / DBVPG 7215 / KCTC 17166 / NRRL Y-17582) TaxID=931890 RepID=G8JV96_ERECY|nr:hypothetical protein Ecym_6192 [Eremothecium cymbalariae DBVPG\